MFSHIDKNFQPSMVTITDKEFTHRLAKARTFISVPSELMKHFVGDEMQSPKGPVFATAIIAGTMAVKKTSELIPFCHPLAIDGCKIIISRHRESEIVIECTVKTFGKTGVEMEALTGASIAALTIYDMCKSMTQDIVIEKTELVEKSGGKHDICKTSNEL